MLKRETLTVEELELLVRARFNILRDGEKRMKTRLCQELGEPLKEDSPEMIAISNKFTDLICVTLAHRLIDPNLRSKPFLSSHELDQVISSLLEISPGAGEEVTAADRKVYEKCLKSIFENMIEQIQTIGSLHENMYEEYWRWVTIVLKLAAKRGLLPTVFLELDVARDEIVRQMYTKEQYIDFSTRSMDAFTNADNLIKIFLQPILDMEEIDPEKREKMMEEIKADVMPALHERCEYIKTIIDQLLSEDVERIYVTS